MRCGLPTLKYISVQNLGSLHKFTNWCCPVPNFNKFCTRQYLLQVQHDVTLHNIAAQMASSWKVVHTHFLHVNLLTSLHALRGLRPLQAVCLSRLSIGFNASNRRVGILPSLPNLYIYPMEFTSPVNDIRQLGCNVCLPSVASKGNRI